MRNGKAIPHNVLCFSVLLPERFDRSAAIAPSAPPERRILRNVVRVQSGDLRVLLLRRLLIEPFPARFPRPIFNYRYHKTSWLRKSNGIQEKYSLPDIFPAVFPVSQGNPGCSKRHTDEKPDSVDWTPGDKIRAVRITERRDELQEFRRGSQAGNDIDEAFGLIETVEKTAQIYMLTLDHVVNEIPDEVIVGLAKLWNLKMMPGVIEEK